jgi:hypothetical protein
MGELIQAIKDVFQGTYPADATPSGGVRPATFEVAYPPAEIAKVFDAGATPADSSGPASR